MMSKFIGRTEELNLLNGLLEKRSASLIVIYGRRRIGKSRLVEEFGHNLKMISFAGLPPQPHMTIQTQLDEFTRQMERQIKVKNLSFSDWSDAFGYLANYTQKGKVIIFFDEISWLGSRDPDFLGKLKNAWDIQFKKNDNLIFIYAVLCRLGLIKTFYQILVFMVAFR